KTIDIDNLWITSSQNYLTASQQPGARLLGGRQVVIGGSVGAEEAACRCFEVDRDSAQQRLCHAAADGAGIVGADLVAVVEVRGVHGPLLVGGEDSEVRVIARDDRPL